MRVCSQPRRPGHRQSGSGAGTLLVLLLSLLLLPIRILKANIWEKLLNELVMVVFLSTRISPLLNCRCISEAKFSKLCSSENEYTTNNYLTTASTLLVCVEAPVLISGLVMRFRVWAASIWLACDIEYFITWDGIKAVSPWASSVKTEATTN